MTSPGKVWYIALKLGVDFSTCNKVLFATQLSKADNCVAFFASNEPKSVLARDLGDCRENYGKLAKRVSHSCVSNEPTNRKDHKWR